MPKLGPAGTPESARALTYRVIFGHETMAGRTFDVLLIAAILASVIAVMLDSVQSWQSQYGSQLRILEWTFTALFTVEYGLRLWCVRQPRAYALSFFGLIDLLAILPTYVSLVIPGGQFLAVIRIMRIMRVFRVLKLVQYVGEASELATALRAARYKISIFLLAVISIVVVVGSLMYMVEGPASGFTSIPRSTYWAIVTLTTVGYGDITPVTPVGQALASLVMIMGYGIIAVPTGIVTAEMVGARRDVGGNARVCNSCEHVEPDQEARFCRRCGASLS